MKTPIHILITAGPTQEPIDSVRYIGNRSSGRMGNALAKAALARKFPTTLLLGPVDSRLTPENSGLSLHRFRTSADLGALLERHWPQHDVLLMAAAVADYRPALASPEKIRRGDAPLTLVLEPVPDLLAVSSKASRPNQVTIGFALEPAEKLIDSARQKLQRKGVDAIVANPLDTMGSEHVSATLISSGGVQMWPGEFDISPTKENFAAWLLEQAVTLWTSKNGG